MSSTEVAEVLTRRQRLNDLSEELYAEFDHPRSIWDEEPANNKYWWNVVNAAIDGCNEAVRWFRMDTIDSAKPTCPARISEYYYLMMDLRL